MSNLCQHGNELKDGLCELCMEENAALEPQIGTETEELGRMQVGFDVVEVQRVGLKEGDVLMVTVKNDDMSQAALDALRYQLSLVFPSNKVFIFGMGTGDDVKFTAVSKEEVAKLENVGYCSNCNCGKKERAEKTLEGESNASSNGECGTGSCGSCGSEGCPS